MYNYNKNKKNQTASPDKYPQGSFKEKPCKICGTPFNPSAPSELYCCETCKGEAASDKYLRRTYGIGWDDYCQMLADQNAKCAICNGEGFVMKGCHKMKLVVDHCHKTGEVRGLLCHNCNRALGLLQDDIKSIENAKAYLERCNDYPERE
jgi:hypothetical protein